MSANPESLELLQRWNEGDRDALGALLAQHREWIEAHVRRKLGPALRGRMDTLDVAQDAVVDFLEYGPRFEIHDEEHLRALFARVVDNNLRDAAKFHRRKKRDIGRADDLADTVLNLEHAAPSAERPSRLLDRSERRAWIRLALEFLGAEDRQVLLLREWDECTFPEIAAALGITESGARMKYQRAVPKLAEKVGELRRGGIVSVLDDADR